MRLGRGGWNRIGFSVDSAGIRVQFGKFGRRDGEGYRQCVPSGSPLLSCHEIATAASFFGQLFHIAILDETRGGVMQPGGTLRGDLCHKLHKASLRLKWKTTGRRARAEKPAINRSPQTKAPVDTYWLGNRPNYLISGVIIDHDRRTNTINQVRPFTDAPTPDEPCKASDLSQDWIWECVMVGESRAASIFGCRRYPCAARRRQ